MSTTTIPEDKVLETKNDNDHHDHYNHLLALPNRRIRTLSENEKIATGQTFKGTIQTFCRNKGHGFIKPDDEEELLFLHVVDIEGEWVPKEGDRVSYKKILIPPKMLKHQAVHVHYLQLNDSVHHEHWDDRN